jgi:hypothetical protein
MSARQIDLLYCFRSAVVLTAAVLGTAPISSCSTDGTSSDGGTGGHSGGAGGAPSAGVGAGGSIPISGSSGSAVAGGGSPGSIGGQGGASGSAGAMAGGDAGGTASGGAAGTAEVSGGAGSSVTTCPLPKTFRWTSTGPLAQPKSGWVALKDFSSVVFNNQHIVYLSTVNNSTNYGGAMMTFTDWPQMATATQSPIPGGTAPTLIYFTPKKIWVLMYEWGPWAFTYLTSVDPTNPSGWSAPHDLYQGSSLDETVLCTPTSYEATA